MITCQLASKQCTRARTWWKDNGTLVETSGFNMCHCHRARTCPDTTVAANTNTTASDDDDDDDDDEQARQTVSEQVSPSDPGTKKTRCEYVGVTKVTSVGDVIRLTPHPMHVTCRGPVCRACSCRHSADHVVET